MSRNDRQGNWLTLIADWAASYPVAAGTLAASAAALASGTQDGFNLKPADLRALALTAVGVAATVFTAVIASYAILFALGSGRRIEQVLHKLGHDLNSNMAGNARLPVIALLLGLVGALYAGSQSWAPHLTLASYAISCVAAVNHTTSLHALLSTELKDRATERRREEQARL